MNKLIVFTLLLVFLVGCRGTLDSSPKPSYYKGDVTSPEDSTSYFQDTRTGICFAERMPYGVDSYTFTEVPCKAVESYYGVNSNTNTVSNTNTGNTNEAISTRKK